MKIRRKASWYVSSDFLVEEIEPQEPTPPKPAPCRECVYLGGVEPPFLCIHPQSPKQFDGNISEDHILDGTKPTWCTVLHHFKKLQEPPLRVCRSCQWKTTDLTRQVCIRCGYSLNDFGETE